MAYEDGEGTEDDNISKTSNDCSNTSNEHGSKWQDIG